MQKHRFDAPELHFNMQIRNLQKDNQSSAARYNNRYKRQKLAARYTKPV